MKLEIQKIRLNELMSFVQSETFNDFATVPITCERAKSYIQNPNAKPNDVVLIMGFIGNKLVAFRTLFAGLANSASRQIHFGWCSGSWVHPGFRRKGFSQQLLNVAFSDWDKKLMFTNYAPNSEELYLKTGWFKPIYQFSGVRAYLFPKTRKLIAKENSNRLLKFIFSIIDFCVSIVSTILVRFLSVSVKNNIRFETISNPDDECYLLNNEKQSEYLLNHNTNILKWIFQYPWISNSEKSFTGNYPFSAHSNLFYYKTVKIFVQNKFAGFFIFSVREGHLKTLHFCFSHKIEKEIAGFIKQYCVTNKIEFVTIYNSEIAEQFFARKFPFLYARKYGQKIYSSFEINNKEKLYFQDGDGDVFFT
ncbi:MAG: hypothetical protein L3J54_01185 [Draconibacterium sp.]|nr:hypothetical protein [Draconibacterium sp.]